MLDLSIQHAFSGFRVDASFSVPSGITALFGPSGSGKTTLVNAVAGLLRPDAGRIVLQGRVLFDSGAGVHVAPHRRQIGYVFQDARLFPHLSVRKNLTYGLRFAPKGATGPSLQDVTDLLGIGDLIDRLPADLSGGEKQRVAIGRAILSRPGMLLMDEPLAALDAPRKSEVLRYLEELRDVLSLPILYVSHDLAEVARIATSLVLLERGRVVRSGLIGDVLADPGSAPMLGLREAGALVTAKVDRHDADGLTRLVCNGGALWLPRVSASLGSELRLRILAQDVMLATKVPEGISALNVLTGRIVEIREGDGPGALVQLAVGETRLLSRVTRRSVSTLGLGVGQTVFAVLKAVSVASENIGVAGRGR